MEGRKTPFGIALFFALILMLFWVGLSTAFSLEMGDFPEFYTAATMAKQGQFASLHSDVLQQSVQSQLLTLQRNPVFFVRPHVYAALLIPLTLLTLRQAFYVWVAAQGLIWIAIVIWAYRRFGNDALVLLGLFPTAILAIGFGQDPTVYLGFAVLSYALYERGNMTLAGFALGCISIKPHLLLLFPVAFLLQKRWRMLWGFVAAGALEGGVSLVLGGFEGAKTYLALLRGRKEYLTPNPERMVNVHGMMVNLGLTDPAIRWTLIAIVIACVLAISFRSEWWQGLAAVQIGSELVAPHVFMYDSTLVVLPALFIFFRSSSLAARIAAAAFFTPIPFLIQLADLPWTIAPSLVLSGLLVTLALDAPFLRRQDFSVATAPPEAA